MNTPSPIGRHKSELDTPALCIDLDLLEANIARMAEFIGARGKQWRPHAKCHKSPVIARKQLAAGAIGITSAKTSEAQVFAEAGIRDILIANMVVGPAKLQRLVHLCEIADPIVACDHYVQAEAISSVCHQRGVRCRVLVEVDLGMQRVGVRPGPNTVALARGVAELPGVTFAGIMGYEGHLLTIADLGEKRQQIGDAMRVLDDCRRQIEEQGIACGIVSAGGTGSYQITAACPGVTELQAGGGIFADPFYGETCQVSGLEPALTLLTTLVSRPALDRGIIDAGRKALFPDVHPPVVLGTVEGRELPDAEVAQLSAEHGRLTLGPKSRDVRIGDRLEIIPGYSDHTTVLHDWFFVVQQGMVVDVWPIAARGKLA